MASFLGTLRRNTKKPGVDKSPELGTKSDSSSKARRNKQSFDIDDVDQSELPNINSQFKRSLSLSKSGRCKSHSKQPANRKTIIDREDLYRQPINGVVNNNNNNTSSPSMVTRQHQQQQQQFNQSQNQSSAQYSPTGYRQNGRVKEPDSYCPVNHPSQSIRTGQSTAL